MNTELDQQVKAALLERKGDWKAIADGSKVSYSWLSKFVNGHIPNPGFAKLRALHDHLNLGKRRKQVA